MSSFLLAVAALVPSIGVGLLFWLAIRSIIRADRHERIAIARLEAAEAAASTTDEVPGGPDRPTPMRSTD